jgi:hypothetical protein
MKKSGFGLRLRLCLPIVEWQTAEIGFGRHCSRTCRPILFFRKAAEKALKNFADLVERCFSEAKALGDFRIARLQAPEIPSRTRWWARAIDGWHLSDEGPPAKLLGNNNFSNFWAGIHRKTPFRSLVQFRRGSLSQ